MLHPQTKRASRVQNPNDEKRSTGLLVKMAKIKRDGMDGCFF
jgi:hypothetical protein